MRTTTSHARQLTRGLAALAVGGTLVLAGCSSDDSDDAASDESSSEAPESPEESPEEESESPEESPEESDASVTYDVPEGWEDVTDEVAAQAGAQSGGEIVSAAREPVDGGSTFAENVNIIRLGAAPTDNLDQIEQQSLQQLEAGGLTEAETLDRVDVDGEESVRQTGVASQQGAEYRVDQFITLRDDQAWVITFSHATDTSDADRQADIDTVTESIDFED